MWLKKGVIDGLLINFSVCRSIIKGNNISKIYLANFLKNLNFFGSIAIPFFIDWIQIDYTRIFLLQAWFIFWTFVLEIPTGIVADKWGSSIGS